MKKRLLSALMKAGFALLKVLSLLPLRIHYMFSDMMYVIVYYLIRYRRQVVRDNLASAFPEKSAAEIKQTEQRFYHWFCDYIVETFKMATISRSEMRRRMVFKGTEQIEQCWAEGQSCGVMLGHYCNWEWVSTLPLAMSDKGVCAELYHPIENPETNQFFLQLRQRFGSDCIPMERALRDIVKYRQQGRPVVVGYIADQKPNWHNIHLWMPFLNHYTPMFTGSERIIKRTGQAYFYGDVRRIRRGYYECEFKLLDRHPDAVADYQLTERYMQEMEKTIRRDPAFWLWSHDRWSRTKEEFDIRFYEKDGKVYEKMSQEDYAVRMGWKSYWDRRPATKE
ncbi:MAG: lysophospholipid acyltransferase family protein [Prevotella sp.]|nr:lysophospholipid acyltransferase family protein [Prevotella sp.]